MSKSFRVVRYIAYVGFALLIPAGLILLALSHSAAFKHHIEQTTSTSFTLDVEIGGPLEISFIRGLRLVAHDVHVRKQAMDVATIGDVDLSIDVLPLLRGEIRLNAIALQNVVVDLVRYQNGSFNFTRPHPHVSLALARISIADATIRLDDMLAKTHYTADNCNAQLVGTSLINRAALTNAGSADISGSLECHEFSKDKLALSNLSLKLLSNNQSLHLQLVTMDLFGAQATGELQVELGTDTPRYQLDYQLPQFMIENFFTLLGPGHKVAGTMDFSAHLTSQGKTWLELKQALDGELLLQGKNLVIHGSDLDEQLARYETTQNFDLVDAGAFLFTGPLGLVATKGFDFANVFIDEGNANSEIHQVISRWQVSSGMARADDVAMNTNKNLIALKGELDFPNGQYKNLHMALLDDKGCVRVEQSIAGSFEQPQIAQPNVLKSLAGPVLKLLKKLTPEQNCDVFYAGSLAAKL